MSPTLALEMALTIAKLSRRLDKAEADLLRAVKVMEKMADIIVDHETRIKELETKWS